VFPNDVEQFEHISSVLIPKFKQYIAENSDESVPVCIEKSFAECKAMVTHPDALPDAPVSDEQLFREIDLTLKYSLRTGKSRFVDKFYCGSDAIAQFSTHLMALINNNCHTFHSSQMLAVIEELTVANLCRMFYNDEHEATRGGVFMPGGSYSNCIAFRLARDKYFPSIRTDGVSSSGQIPVALCSDQSHYCVATSMEQIGIGSNNVIKLETRFDGTIDMEKCVQRIEELVAANKKPFVFSCNAGSTVLGAFDDFRTIARVCREYDIWMHVDACWGGSAVFARDRNPQLAALFDGIEAADSMSYDAHKFISTGILCGCLLVKDESYLLSSCSPPNAQYLFHGGAESHDFSLKTLQCGRQSDAVKLYMSWLYYGRDGLADRVLNAMRNAEYLVQQIKASDDLLLVQDPGFCNVCFWYVDAEHRSKVKAWKEGGYATPDPELFAVLESNTKEIYARLADCKVDYSPCKGLPSFFRMITSNYRMGTQDVDIILDDIRNARALISK